MVCCRYLEREDPIAVYLRIFDIILILLINDLSLRFSEVKRLSKQYWDMMHHVLGVKKIGRNMNKGVNGNGYCDWGKLIPRCGIKKIRRRHDTSCPYVPVNLVCKRPYVRVRIIGSLITSSNLWARRVWRGCEI